jgi:hypothetical protein
MISHVKGQINLGDFMTFFVKCLIQNSNYEEIISSVDYLHEVKLPLNDEPISQLLMCFVNYDDWSSFKKYFQVYFESRCVSDATVKRVISALVEKSSLDMLRFVVTVTMREKDTFMNLKLSENQYKCIILSLVKSNMSISGKIAREPKSAELTRNVSESPNDSPTGHPRSLAFETIKSDMDSSEEFFEIIDEDMINRIISDIATNEKKSSK